MMLRIIASSLALTAAAPVAQSAPSTSLSHKFNLVANDMVTETCQGDEGPERSKISVRATKISSRYFTAAIKVKVCTNGFGFRKVNFKANLPAEVLDVNAIAAMKPGAQIVVGNIPSTVNPGTQNEILITRGASSGSVHAVTLTWSSNGGKPDYLPVTVWVGSSPDVFSGVRGFNASKSLPWKRIRLGYSHAFLSNPLTFAGSLSRIDQE